MGSSMRGLLSVGLLTYAALIQPAVHQKVIEPERAIPRFILYGDIWVCLDRDPRQVRRNDCAPRQK
jgi:hypothetical protein